MRGIDIANPPAAGMSLQGPIVVVSEHPATELVAALQAAGALPVVEASCTDAPDAISSIEPAAIVLAEPAPVLDPGYAARLTDRLQRDSRLYTPLLGCVRPGLAAAVPGALPCATEAPFERLIARLRSALRVRALHATVLRRAQARSAKGTVIPGLASDDPLSDATVLLIGRGRSFPALSIALGEQVGVIGAFSAENAARYLNARDIDGIAIGEGFAPHIIKAVLTVLAENARFRDLPVAVLGGTPAFVDEFGGQLANFERIESDAALLADRLMPLVRQHAFVGRLTRALKAIDADGMLDPDTGLLVRDAFWRDVTNAVGDAEHRGVALSLARFSFGESVDRRISTDAARIVSRLVRSVDLACREGDNSIIALFTETDLRSAHVVARRIASVLRHTMLAPDSARNGIDTEVTLATLKSSDTAESLIARVRGQSTNRVP